MRDYETALKLWQPLADQGNPRAQYWIGDMYEHGHGVDKDNAEAMKWYRKAADQGNAHAQESIGYMYGDGSGVKKDPEESIKWYLKAANQGFWHSWFFLSLDYYNGLFVKKDYEEAYFWELLARVTEPPKMIPLATHYPTMSGQHLSEEQQSAVATRVHDWCQIRADQGTAWAQYTLGRAYENEQPGNQPDAIEAMKWYRKAADHGHTQAQFHLGLMYAYGRGGPENVAEAYFWVLLAKKSGVDPDDYEGEYEMESIVREGGLLAKQLTSEQIIALNKRVAEWKPTPTPTPAKPETK